MLIPGPAVVQANLGCICLEGCPGYKSRLAPVEFVQSQSGYQEFGLSGMHRHLRASVQIQQNCAK